MLIAENLKIQMSIQGEKNHAPTTQADQLAYYGFLGSFTTRCIYLPASDHLLETHLHIQVEVLGERFFWYSLM